MSSDTEERKEKTVKIRLLHRSAIPHARWCEPVGWEPTNRIEGEWIDGGWWSETDEEAGIVWFGEGQEGDEVEADLDDLRVVSCGDCRVIGEVELE